MKAEGERLVGIDTAISRTASRSLIPALDALGYGTETLQEPFRWATKHPTNPVVVAIPQRTPLHFQAIRTTTPSPIIIGISDHTPSPSTYRAYLTAGATNIVGTDLPHDALSRVLASALKGFVELPQRVFSAIVEHPQMPPAGLRLTARDRRLLNLIAQGSSRAAITAEIGCSERHLRRITSDLQRRIGAINRAHAAALATRWGLVARIDSSPREEMDEEPS